MTLSKQCKCRGCSSGSHGLGKSDELGACTTRYADAPFLWEHGICPACLTAKRQLPRVPHKHFFGKGVPIHDIAVKIAEMSNAALDAAEKK